MRLASILLCALLGGCAFNPPPALPPREPLLNWVGRQPLSNLVDSGDVTAFEEPNAIVVYHGYGCAESREAERQKILVVEQSHALPAGMFATVFLNGWEFQYLNGDHNLLGLGTAIFDIRPEDKKLTWRAAGIMSDDDFGDPYRWCYRYTIVVWNSAVYRISADARDDFAFSAENVGPGWETALTVHPTFLPVKDFRPNAKLLPRGFGFVWRESSPMAGIGKFPPLLDHNLFQIAYHLDDGERFIADGKRYVVPNPGFGGADQVATELYSWETKTIYKDSARWRDHATAEVVSVVSGPAVGMVRPPFTIVPFETLGSCISTGEPERVTRKVEKVPFDVAIPVLTGWDLSYDCTDHNVEAIGTMIESFTYTPGTDRVDTLSGLRPAGTLQYTTRSVLRDAPTARYGTRFRNRVSILGFDRVR